MQTSFFKWVFNTATTDQEEPTPRIYPVAMAIITFPRRVLSIDIKDR
jgi:hypothetical protein